MRHSARLTTTLFALLLIGGCAPLLTQSPGKGLSPVNAVSEGEDKHLMLLDRKSVV